MRRVILDEYREISIREVITCLWTRKWIIVLTTIFCGLALWAYSTYYITPQYQTSVRLYVNNRTESTTSLTSSDMTAAKSLVDTYITIIQSTSLLEEVSENVGGYYSPGAIRSMISAGAVNNTEVFVVSITNPSPEEAAKIANAIADTAPDFIKEIVEGSSVKIIDRAPVPSYPISPNVSRNTTIGALIGLVLSALIILLVYIFDTTIYSEDDIKEFCVLPILGIFGDFGQYKTDKNIREYKGRRTAK